MSGPFLSMSQDTYKVSLRDVFGGNRRKLCAALMQPQRLPNMVSHTSSTNSVVFLQGGPSTTRFDSDHEPIFRQESYFLYLTGVKEPDCAVAIDVASTRTTLFVPKLDPSYAIAMGAIKTPEQWTIDYQVDEVLYVEDIEPFLANQLHAADSGASSRAKLCRCSNVVCMCVLFSGMLVCLFQPVYPLILSEYNILLPGHTTRLFA
jgi:Aminopeptidase P, N-terminal domain